MCFFFSSRRRHTRFDCDWSSDVCSSDLLEDSCAPVTSLWKTKAIVDLLLRSAGAGGSGPPGVRAERPNIAWQRWDTCSFVPPLPRGLAPEPDSNHLPMRVILGALPFMCPRTVSIITLLSDSTSLERGDAYARSYCGSCSPQTYGASRRDSRLGGAGPIGPIRGPFWAHVPHVATRAV